MTENKLTAYQRRSLQNQERIGKALERIADALAPEEEPATGNSVNGIPRFSQGGTIFGGGGPFGPGGASVFPGAVNVQMNRQSIEQALIETTHPRVQPMTETDL